jgi:uncharacterized integral membrane protein
LAVPKFVKNPRLIIGVLLGLYLAYLIDANLDQAVGITLFPRVQWQLPLLVVMTACVAFGCGATLALQYLWRRRQASKPSEHLSAASEDSSKTST